MTNERESLSSGLQYATVVADPAWSITRPTGWGTKDKNHQPLAYPTMTDDEIASLPVASIVADTAYLFLWTVNSKIEAAYSVARAWGFRPVTLLTWCKKPHGMGPGGHFASTTEHILYARRGSSGKDFGRARLHDSTWFDWPKAAHSVKPEQFQDLVQTNFPEPRLELFARRRRIGWDVWGNEVDSDVELSRDRDATPPRCSTSTTYAAGSATANTDGSTDETS